MLRALAWLGSHGRPALALGIFAGIAWADLAALAAPLLVPAVFVLLTLSLLRVDWADIAVHMRRPVPVTAAMVWLLLVSPAVVLALVAATPLPDGLKTAIVLMTAAPPVMASIAFALLLRLDAPLAVIPTFAATMLSPLTLPPVALSLLGLELEIALGEYMLRLALLAGGALGLAAVLRRVIPPEVLTRGAPALDGGAVVMLLVFAVAIMDGVQAVLIDRPAYAALHTAAAFGANIGLQALGTLVFAWLGLRGALTAGLLSGNRNMGMQLAALGASAGPDVALFFALAQIPMYVLPTLQAPLYRRWLGTAAPAA